MAWRKAAWAAAVAAAAGCVDYGSLSQPPEEASQGRAAPTAEPAEQPPGEASAAEQPAAARTERRRADVGVGRKGRSLDDEQGVGRIIAEPARAYFATKERLVFQVQIPHAMQLYKAANGEAPQSHEQFMREIIEANRIALPELPAGQRYVYDPETEELMVEGPRR